MELSLVAAHVARSLQPAQVDINVLIRQSIARQIDDIITDHPSCPASASAEVDLLLQTDERLGGD